VRHLGGKRVETVRNNRQVDTADPLVAKPREELKYNLHGNGEIDLRYNPSDPRRECGTNDKWHEQVYEIFLKARELSGEEREKYLGEACGDDVALRKEVESLLAHDGTTTTTLNPLQADQIPDRIGPYSLLERIGEGGMGEVWAAEQGAPVRHRVALKVIKRGMDTKQGWPGSGADDRSLDSHRVRTPASDVGCLRPDHEEEFRTQWWDRNGQAGTSRLRWCAIRGEVTEGVA